MNNNDNWWIVENEDETVVALIKNPKLAKKFQQENEKYGHCYEIKKQERNTENERYVGYYLNNVNGELASVIDQENHCHHIDYTKVVDLLNEQDMEISRLEEANCRLTYEASKYLVELNNLQGEHSVLEIENEELKQTLLFYLDIATSECSSNYREDMEKWCNILFDCSHSEAKEKYGDFKYAERWELGD